MKGREETSIKYQHFQLLFFTFLMQRERSLPISIPAAVEGQARTLQKPFPYPINCREMALPLECQLKFKPSHRLLFDH